jgi:hypothetical protein
VLPRLDALLPGRLLFSDTPPLAQMVKHKVRAQLPAGPAASSTPIPAALRMLQVLRRAPRPCARRARPPAPAQLCACLTLALACCLAAG